MKVRGGDGVMGGGRMESECDGGGENGIWGNVMGVGGESEGQICRNTFE
jgi:hypothetical protein